MRGIHIYTRSFGPDRELVDAHHAGVDVKKTVEAAILELPEGTRAEMRKKLRMVVELGPRANVEGFEVSDKASDSAAWLWARSCEVVS